MERHSSFIIHVRGDDALDGEEVGPLMRLFRQFLIDVIDQFGAEYSLFRGVHGAKGLGTGRASVGELPFIHSSGVEVKPILLYVNLTL